MPTNDERRELAARLRELPCIPSELYQWKGRELFLEPSRYDEADYAQIHRILLGCFPADIMHPCDYEDLHDRLADLIEPEERTCRVVTEMRALSQTQDKHTKSCSSCGYVFGSEEHRQLLPGLGERVAINPVRIPKFCPNCGAKVVQQ